jgi:hypothetical protein
MSFISGVIGFISGAIISPIIIWRIFRIVDKIQKWD